MDELTPAVGRQLAKPPVPHALRDNTNLHNAVATRHFGALGSVLPWRRIEEMVAPVIGIRGVGAIYGRSLSCARRAYPWLPTVDHCPVSRIEWARLGEALAGQPAREASLADALLSQTFRDLLASLVGTRLAGRLLEPRIEASDGNGRQEENPE